MTEQIADVLIAWLHDPPDKAIDIRGHESRARRYLAQALGRAVSESELKGGREDSLASVAERLPLPSPGENYKRAVGVENGTLTVYHPLSAEERTLGNIGNLDEGVLLDVIQEIVKPYEEVDKKYYALWRLLPERLAAIAPWFASLPADTRVPDHTIWHHLDITAGLQPALAAAGGAALLWLSIGPVQPFIAAAQSVRDLWSGSMILSRMSFQAMLPIVERLGPTAIVFPALRGVPMLDRWLVEKKHLVELPAIDREALKSPCLPNRFLAVVPYGPSGETARDILQQCIESARRAWHALAADVRTRLRQKWTGPGIDAAWDARWDAQVESFFDIRGAVMPLSEVGDATVCRLLGGDLKAIAPHVAAVRALAEAIPKNDQPGYRQDGAGHWQMQNELAARLLEAQRSVRHMPPHTERSADAQYAQKCSLMGSFEQMGPADRKSSSEFWREARQRSVDGIAVRDREALCAVALTKRFAPIVLADKLRLALDELKYGDTATAAAAEWLEKAKLDKDTPLDYTDYRGWNGQWLHVSGKDAHGEEAPPHGLPDKVRKLRHPDRLGAPPLYYAVLMMDGDEMGEWLAGRKSPSVSKVLHPRLRNYFIGLTERGDEDRNRTVNEGLDARRPLGPARHAAISEALSNFALHIVPQVVADHYGTLIYAGGDDVLALLPCRRALACARELALAFSGDRAVNHDAPPGYYRVENGKAGTCRDLLMMGPTATVSAGIAVVHYKEDLRLALQAARNAEKAAKRSGRNAAQLVVCRRSGEHASFLCPWDLTDRFQQLVEAFDNGASDRWAYQLRGDAEALAGTDLPVGLLQAEIRRRVQGAERPTLEKICAAMKIEADKAEKAAREAGTAMVRLFEDYHTEMKRWDRQHSSPHEQESPQQVAIRGFITLCQSASFLARGGRET